MLQKDQIVKLDIGIQKQGIVNLLAYYQNELVELSDWQVYESCSLLGDGSGYLPETYNSKITRLKLVEDIVKYLKNYTQLDKQMKLC